MEINQVKFAKVVEAAKAKSAGHPEWLRAIEKAARMLQSGELCVTLFGDGTALVTSPNGSYQVNGACNCAARTAHCYHRAAKRLIELLEAEPETKPAPRKPVIERSVEREFNAKTGKVGKRLQVVRCNNWPV